ANSSTNISDLIADRNSRSQIEFHCYPHILNIISYHNSETHMRGLITSGLDPMRDLMLKNSADRQSLLVSSCIIIDRIQLNLISVAYNHKLKKHERLNRKKLSNLL
ncbi:unnamed protein product, partial [Trichobilharzia regenti]